MPPKKKKVEIIKKPKIKAMVVKQETSPAEMIKAAVAGGADLDKLEKLLNLQERWEANEAKKAYNSAMVEVHRDIPLITKTLKNPLTHSSYAALDRIISKTKAIYTSQGFSISFYEGQTEKPEHIRICADVIHRLGHKETYYYDVPLDGVGIKGNANMTKIHAKASSTSYGRRYLMCMIWNTPTGDDDGNAASVELITDIQLENIKRQMKELGVEKQEKKFLEFLEVEKLEDIPKSSYKKAEDALEAKRQAKKQK